MPIALPSGSVLLTNGRYSVRLGALGSGYADWNSLAVSRWSDDRTCDVDGFHVYLRDLDDGFIWSAAYQPTQIMPARYEFRNGGGVAEIVRLDRDLECRFSVCVALHYDCELRRCRITNHGHELRRVELTSYLEWVLTKREADANHPAFSKLFIETQFDAKRAAILARRRPRGADEPAIWGCHALVRDGDAKDASPIQFETSRVDFIGRGRNIQRPQALIGTAELPGKVGPVLDPIASLRTAVTLLPGESQEVTFMLGAARNRADIDELLAAFDDVSAANSAFQAVWEPDSTLEPAGNGAAAWGQIAAEQQRVTVHSAHQARRPTPGRPRGQYEFQSESACAGIARQPVSAPEPLQFENGYGGFSPNGREYVIRLKSNADGTLRLPPMPWVNVIANELAGFIVSESGAGYMWAGNSRLNRLTAWHNDPVCDPPSEAVWIRDDDAGEFWSAAPCPTPADAEYTVRHGLGYTTFRHTSHELVHELTVFMSRDEPLKLTKLRLMNLSDQQRRLSVFSYVHWALGGLAAETRDCVSTTYSPDLQAILATNGEREHYGGHVSFSAVQLGDGFQQTEKSYTCDRHAFIGGRNITAPAALTSHRPLDGRSEIVSDPCAAWQLPIELAPGEERECVFLLGETSDRDAAAELIKQYRDSGSADRELQAVKEFWQSTVSGIQIETPDREIDLMVNGWLTYQNLSCRMWGRSAYYQPGGAFGYRDQLQDAAALLFVRPDLTRGQILRHASQQFVEGDVLHWWHPDTGYGLRTRFSDDLLWLPYVTACYVEATGDESVLDVQAPFVVGPELAAGQDEAYLLPSHSGYEAALYEHCCRALDRGLTRGSHGLPLMGSGDWNDGMNRVGRRGYGESVWLGFFIHFVLGHFLPICVARGDDERVERYTAYRDRLADALNSEGWDGGWYRRAYYDNGDRLGSAGSDECQIDALAQAWAVLSGVATAERAQSAMDAVDERLVCREAGMIKLLTPPFDRTSNDPGYIKGYLPGIRENGGQYTHGVLWVVRAMAEMGRGTCAVELLRMLSPVWHTAIGARTDVYQTEPYVLAADVYGEPPHVGRGGWTWYTGSAGWMFRVAVESIFGLSVEHGRTLVVKPCISSVWPQCRLTYRLPGEDTRYEITIQNPNGKETTVASATLDGSSMETEDGAARIPLVHDGGLHRVLIWL